ncbi:LysR substrate-binding domain-containing protein [Celerinatantimonas diazotrophica]|uniref:Transcriptional regulator n=1 Tax=Celerinatantimonas diazotrophica TaxID=412034 RepID=A0A4V2PRG5_9GAMM|nr:LysR substrate-binding domain-containing protein [Celerinatantimonas diazotrophica]TCK58761.1 transcriptional regulator [Celerinatantimonas diazotrophica]CAG9297392.1 Glycine cleavage system transcriptional activator [Celerinatantimonas diazotrophica]
MDSRLRYLSALCFFESAARLKSYSKAAEELHVTQAAISQKLRQLEERLGCKLFIRRGREMHLTDKGQILHKHVNDGFNNIITGLNRIQNEPLEGVLNVSAPRSFSTRWLMPRLWKFTTEFPHVPIRVQAIKEIDIRHTQTDVLIWQGDESVAHLDLEQETLFEEAIYPYCSPELANAMKFTSPEQLLKCWLIDFHSASFSWEKWFEYANVGAKKEGIQWMEVGTFDMAINAVVAGHGACLATESICADFVERGLLVRPFNIGLNPGIRYSVISDPSSSRILRINAFKSWLQQELNF